MQLKARPYLGTSIREISLPIASSCKKLKLLPPKIAEKYTTSGQNCQTSLYRNKFSRLPDIDMIAPSFHITYIESNRAMHTQVHLEHSGRMLDSQSSEPMFESPSLPFRSLGIFVLSTFVRNCCVARMLSREVASVLEWTGRSAVQRTGYMRKTLYKNIPFFTSEQLCNNMIVWNNVIYPMNVLSHYYLVHSP